MTAQGEQIAAAIENTEAPQGWGPVESQNFYGGIVVAASIARNYVPSTDDVTDRLCGDYPAPCNCDDPETHDGAVTDDAAVAPDGIALAKWLCERFGGATLDSDDDFLAARYSVWRDHARALQAFQRFDDAAVDEAAVLKAVHKQLAKDHFGKFTPHPAFMEADSDMGQQAKRITKAVLATVPVSPSDAGKTRSLTRSELDALASDTNPPVAGLRPKRSDAGGAPTSSLRQAAPKFEVGDDGGLRAAQRDAWEDGWRVGRSDGRHQMIDHARPRSANPYAAHPAVDRG